MNNIATPLLTSGAATNANPKLREAVYATLERCLTHGGTFKPGVATSLAPVRGAAALLDRTAIPHVTPPPAPPRPSARSSKSRSAD